MNKSFSERIGIAAPTPELQLTDMNDALRNSIWNVIHSLFDVYQSNYWTSLAEWTAHHFRKVPVDELPPYDYRCMEWIKSYFMSLSWNRKYEFVEFVVKNYEQIQRYPKHRRGDLERMFNGIFEREMSGYRFISGVLAPISNPAESAEISDAIRATTHSGLDGARHHLHTALSLLAKKPDPDYRNSIKESISAVESVAKVLGKEDSKGLADALNELGKKTNLHNSLRSGFNSLYGYTSDKDGIRHALLDEPNVGFDDAKYMAVACSAFVNYLIAKASTAGLLK